MSLILLGLWFTLAVLLGFLLYIIFPVLVSSVPDEYLDIAYKNKVAQWYFGLSMASFRRVLCAITPHNDADLIRSKWDGERQTEKIKIDKKANDFEDPKGNVSRCKNIPFSFVLSDKNKIIDPMDAEMGEAIHERDEKGDDWAQFQITQSVQTDGGEVVEEPHSIRAHNAHVELSETIKAVNMQLARKVLPECHEPNDPNKAEENVIKSQQGFQNRSMADIGAMLIVCLAAALTAWVIYSNTGDTDSVVTLPVTIFGWWL